MRLFAVLPILLLLSSCGPKAANQAHFQNQNNFNIIDGENVVSRETKASKSVIAVEMTDKNHQPISHCTGVMIGPQTVLTAAHCFNPTLIPGVVGFNIVFENRTAHISNPTKRLGFSYIQHPLYNHNPKRWIYRDRKYIDPNTTTDFKPAPGDVEVFTEQSDHDLAVLVFEEEAPSAFDFVQIDTDIKADYSGKPIDVYGYGRSVDYLDPNGKYDTSMGFLRHGIIIVDSDFNLFEDRYFTAEISKNSLCQGDSGGPQFFNEKGVPKVIGINSAVASDPDSVVVSEDIAEGHYLSCRGRSQVAKVAPYSDWIRAEEKIILNELKVKENEK